MATTHDWRPCATPPALPEATVHVWFADLDVDATTLARLAGVTSEAERARAERLRVGSASRRFLAARGILRTLLGAYLGCPPAAVPLTAGGGNEKPRLLTPEEPELRFNVSHSGDAALLAFARRREVGIDIECHATGRTAERLARRFLTDAERRLLESLDEPARSRAALAMWTRKEAMAKARGTGVYRSGLPELELGLGSDGEWLTTVDPAPGKEWSVRSIRPPDGACAAAVAIEGGPAPLECVRWTSGNGPMPAWGI